MRMMKMKISTKGLNLIKEFEGCYLKAYQDSGGVWTIGIGITNADKAITGKTIKAGLKITQSTADKWLLQALDKIYIPKVIKYDHIYHWNQNQFDALVSFCYNIGSIDQLTADGSRSIQTIADKMLLYVKDNNKVLKGLQRRRQAEHDLFVEPMAKQGYPGKYPVMPARGYFKFGDGYISLRSHTTQIKRVQSVVNWVMGFSLTVDGEYGQKTDKAVTQLQKRFGLNPNGCFGEKCLRVCKGYKK